MQPIHSYVALLAAAALTMGCHRENGPAQTPVDSSMSELQPASGPAASATKNTSGAVNGSEGDGASTGNPGAGSATTGSGPGTTGTASGHHDPPTIAPGTIAPGSANTPPGTSDAGSPAPGKSESTKGSGLR